MNIELISIAVSALAIVVSIVLFWIDFQRRKKTETLQELNHIFDLYYSLPGKDTNKNYKDLVVFMSHLDRFAVAVNTNIFDKKTVKTRAGILMDSVYKEFVKEIAEQRRQQFHREDYYEDTIQMINSIRGN